MSDQEDLIRYLLEETTEPERERIEQRLYQEHALRKQLEQLRQCLGMQDGEAQAGLETPPEGLADRTADSVTDLCLEDLHRAQCGTLGGKEKTSLVRFSLLDFAAVSFALLLIAMIAAPAILSSRSTSRRISCEQNLGSLGKSLLTYAEDHGNQFPNVGPHRNAGVFTVMLAEEGYADRDELSRWVVCPSSQLAQQIASHSAIIWVPTQQELFATHALLFERAKRFMSGSYAYRIGHYDRDRYVPVRNRGDARAALLSDAPSVRGVTSTSPNHGCCGQNVLYQDGSIKFLSGCRTAGARDHLFLNDAGQVAAGQNWSDTVLVRSEVSPRPPVLVQVAR